jgi:hypothetical protein
MKSSKWLVIVAIFMVVIGSVSTSFAPPMSTEGPVSLYVSAYLSPYPMTNSTGVPTNSLYITTASNVVHDIYMDGKPSIAVTNHVLHTGYVWQPANHTNHSLWFSVRVVAKDANYRFLPGCLTFIGKSTAGWLDKTNVFTDPMNYYSYTSKGVIWAPELGPRVSDTSASGYWKNTPVNEFIFNGAASRFGSGTYQSVDDYIYSFPDDFKVTGTWIFDDGTNNPVRTSVTLHTKKNPSNGILAIRVFTNAVNVIIGMNSSDEDSWIVQSAPKVVVSQMNWSDDTTMSAGDIIIRPAVGVSQRYWRAILQ